MNKEDIQKYVDNRPEGEAPILLTEPVEGCYAITVPRGMNGKITASIYGNKVEITTKGMRLSDITYLTNQGYELDAQIGDRVKGTVSSKDELANLVDALVNMPTK
ncbi:MAG: hypothetical protein U9R08_06705 [Nanoarchaeota archaeon]|nr:hypothetical protein [Nanoarchaeota archaeon]